jgi:LacI family transcriptional regulator
VKDDRPTPAPRQTRDVTITQVARAAGVSISTVSKALNGTGTIGEATRSRVLEVARALDFRPNSLARSLHTGLSKTVGLISNDNFGRFTMPILEGLEAELQSDGVAVFMCNATDDPELERRHVESLLAKRVDGLIVTARRSDHRPTMDLKPMRIPVIYVFAQPEDTEALVLVPDDQGGALLATEHLLRLGRKRILHITGPARFEAVRLRLAGYRAALAQAGRGEGLCLNGSWSEEWGREAVARLLAKGARPDGLVCGNDQIARGAADALREAGLSVPTDVAVIGFDNWSVMTEASRPPLTSVDMNLTELGREAARRLMRMIDGETQGGVVRRPCSLVMRGSCGGAAGMQTQSGAMM